MVVVRWHAERAGLPVRVWPHMLRHATHLLRGGADVRHISELPPREPGHGESLHRVEIEDLKEAMARAHPQERAPGVDSGRQNPPVTQGELGIRHEDVITITEDGALNLTKWSGSPEEAALV